MGVKQFFQLVDPEDINIKSLKGQTIAIDAMTEIYRVYLATFMVSHNINNEDDSCEISAEPTLYLNSILLQCINYQKNNVTAIWVFDSPDFHIDKANELSKRKDKKDTAFKNGDLKRSVCITKTIINAVIELLTLLGITYIVSPSQFDAEHVCAYLNHIGKAQYVLTTDADALLYGAISIIKYEKRKMMLYTRKMYCDQLLIKDDDILKIGVALGTDYNEKIKGIGKITVIKKLHQLQFNEEQQKAIKKFTSDVPELTFHTNKLDKEKLKTFLLSKNFAYERIDKLLLNFAV